MRERLWTITHTSYITNNTYNTETQTQQELTHQQDDTFRYVGSLPCMEDTKFAAYLQ